MANWEEVSHGDVKDTPKYWVVNIAYAQTGPQWGEAFKEMGRAPAIPVGIAYSCCLQHASKDSPIVVLVMSADDAGSLIATVEAAARRLGCGAAVRAAVDQRHAALGELRVSPGE
jgi:hypothetical protein